MTKKEIENLSTNEALDLFFRLVKEKEERWREIRRQYHWVCNCPESFIYPYAVGKCEICGTHATQFGSLGHQQS